MEGKQLLRGIHLKNVLSYGDGRGELRLEPLNVFIGTNASGKSNLIEALSLLAAAPVDLLKPIREGGGTGEWLWKGSKTEPVASIEATLDGPDAKELRYALSFTERAHRFELVDEALEDADGDLYQYRDGRPVLAVRESGKRSARELNGDIAVSKSILSQRRDIDLYPELTHVATQFAEMRFFRESNLGRRIAPRMAQTVDLPEDFLLEDASNLWLVLANLISEPDLKELLLDKLRAVFGPLEDIRVKIQAGTVQIFFHEEGLYRGVPGFRLSDGMLRFLCLLTILCHPNPPPLIAIEEPELGLHPDAVSVVGELLLAASQKTQLIVTTHSSTLVSALSDTPEAIVVTERDSGGTTFKRLEPDALSSWLERYELGEVWQMGEIGGNRW